MRAFIAIDIPQSIRERIDSLQQELKKSGADVRWTRPRGIHLTLKFLGEIKEGKVVEIIDKLKANIASFDSLKIRLRKVGGFPSLKRPRVIWIGVETRGAGLKQLQSEIERSLQSLGFPPESRDFKPHLTLGRVRSLRGQVPLLEMIKEKADKELGEFAADCFYLFQSILKPSGAEYHKIHQFMLTKKS